MKYFSGLLALALMAGTSVFPVSAQVQVQHTLTTEATYRLGSPEAHQVQQWLAAHAAYANGGMVGDIDQLGDIHIAYKLSQDTTKAAPGGSPPVPLPASGRPGDSISISSTSGNIIQTWTYSWLSNSTGGGWYLQSYTWKLKNSPAPQ